MTRDATDSSEFGHGILPERTYERLRDRIIRGRISPGERVIESEVARQLGVSRTPVREALAQLTRDGFLVPTSSGRRTELAVAPLDAPSVLDLWSIIAALEGQAVRMLMRESQVERARVADDLRRINELLVRLGNVRPRDPDGLVERQAEFHDRYVRPYAGARLLRVYDSVRPHVQRYEWAFGQHYETELAESVREHEAIADAISDGDGVRARDAVEDHWTRAAVRTAAVIARLTLKSTKTRLHVGKAE